MFTLFLPLTVESIYKISPLTVSVKYILPFDGKIFLYFSLLRCYTRFEVLTVEYNFKPILDRIRAAKAAKGYTIDELSEMSQIPVGTLNKIISGATNEPKLPALMALAHALGVSVDYLIYGKNETDAFSTDELELIKKYRQLDPRGQAAVMDTIEREFLYSTSASRAADAKKLADDVLECMAGADLNEPVRKANE